MKEIQNVAKMNDEVTLGVRSQCRKRACTICFMLEEALKEGLSNEKFTRSAIYRYGEVGGKKLKAQMKDPSDLVEFSEYFGVGLDRNTYEMEIVENNQDKFYIDFHYCPYVEEWLSLGRDPKEIELLCDLAMEGDRAIGDCFDDFNFTLGKTIAQGNPVCQIRFDRVKK